MRFFHIEHSRTAYIADFCLYGLVVLGMALLLVFYTPVPQRRSASLFAFVGLMSWSLLEYALHRVVLHAWPLFKAMHAAHHERPTALICTPTIISATLIGGLIFVPSLLTLNLWHAIALTFGVLAGYLAYAITHHGIHHWRTDNRWLKHRKYRHALHHRPNSPHACYGVTNSFWDRVFHTD
ncbi:MAG TPA: sterol desaturase family protein [Aquabacterium sp.]|uniref:sterol desaturase family protein n=1 Tax=Aquabacterium sp. TaxID=1872578 RepID=UPI002E374DD1|nr:sterol desaturase family protein [Aquabacterium sp.]HEX5357151.1 sterol desaturase family protein [Aquabacterium sp.]